MIVKQVCIPYWHVMQRTKLDIFPNRSASAEEKQKRKIRRGE